MNGKKILFIDNFDSFTYNLVDEFEKRDCDVTVYRNAVSMETVRSYVTFMQPQLIVISPGPSTPKEAGISVEVVREFSGKTPVFGVCLGHQCIIEAFGGSIDRAPEVVHGKASAVTHDEKTIFAGLSNPFRAGRYHSLCGTSIPDELEVSAQYESIVMGVRHKKLPVEGVQFHPESILTPEGGRMIENYLNLLTRIR